MMRVTFQENSVLVNGDEVARLEGSREVYITMKNAEDKFVVVARFKYRSPKAGAKHWLKFILARKTSVEIVEALKYVPGQPPETPLGMAWKLGYLSLNEIKAAKHKAEQELLRNTPVRIVTM